jgi:hypothetical protein
VKIIIEQVTISSTENGEIKISQNYMGEDTDILISTIQVETVIEALQEVKEKLNDKLSMGNYGTFDVNDLSILDYINKEITGEVERVDKNCVLGYFYEDKFCDNRLDALIDGSYLAEHRNSDGSIFLNITTAGEHILSMYKNAI